MRSVLASRDRVVNGVLSIAIALFALGCTALPFMPPGLCGAIAFALSVAGTIFATRGVVRDRFRWSNRLCILGSILNLIVVLVASLVWGSETHLIDRLERDSGWLLGFVCIAPFVALFLVLGLLVWASVRRG